MKQTPIIKVVSTAADLPAAMSGLGQRPQATAVHLDTHQPINAKALLGLPRLIDPRQK